MRFEANKSMLFVAPAPWAADHVAKDVSANDGGVAARMQADPKKLGKEKKPGVNLVRLVFRV
jgi:hypothetical protein